MTLPNWSRNVGTVSFWLVPEQEKYVGTPDGNWTALSTCATVIDTLALKTPAALVCTLRPYDPAW